MFGRKSPTSGPGRQRVKVVGLSSAQMFSSLKSRAGVLALTASMAAVPVVGMASSAGAAPNANRCKSIDGVVVYQSGTATCITAQSTGSEPNVATASGDNSYAAAGIGAPGFGIGSGDTATASGDNSYAQAIAGSSDTATAHGDHSVAASGAGNNDSATAHGSFSFAAAGFGNNNTSSANGNSSVATAGLGDSDTATAHGSNSFAQAGPGSNDTATANGPCTIALVGVDGATDSCHP